MQRAEKTLRFQSTSCLVVGMAVQEAVEAYFDRASSGSERFQNILTGSQTGWIIATSFSLLGPRQLFILLLDLRMLSNGEAEGQQYSIWSDPSGTRGPTFYS
ncbi:hypothetical protein FS837_010091 [Tulasnella sp. UAMH 9824]|nr:hypothetical protein FS837_010091 [Tulasnella sp. UAMH 9824]